MNLDYGEPLRYPLSEGFTVASHPKRSAKNETGEFDNFRNYVSRVLSVPHAQIKAQLDAEKREKLAKKQAASRASSDRG